MPTRSPSRGRTKGARALGLAVAALAVLALPSAGGGQTLADLFQAIREGGGWVAIPIDAGRGSVETRPVPTSGLELAGCVRVWSGHSGIWELQAVDAVAEDSLAATVRPGSPRRFQYRSGLRAQLQLDVSWSEPRDTTLLLWVGLEGLGEEDRDPCQPHHGGRGSGRTPRWPAAFPP